MGPRGFDGTGSPFTVLRSGLQPPLLPTARAYEFVMSDTITIALRSLNTFSSQFFCSSCGAGGFLGGFAAVSSNLKSVQQQIDEIRSLISEAQQTLAQANYALSTLLERLDEQEPEEPRWARPRGPV